MQKKAQTKTANRVLMMTEHQDLRTNTITVSLIRANYKPLVGSPTALSKKSAIIRQLSKKMAMRLAMLVIIESLGNVQKQIEIKQPIVEEMACAA